VRSIERDVIPITKQLGIGQVVWSPIAQGVLTGKYAPGAQPPEGTRAANPEDRSFMERLMDDRVLEAVQRLRPVAEDAGLTMAQLAIAWVLREENVASAIIGASRPEQVEENVGASGVELPEHILRAIDEIVGPVALS
jgi:aryl-alcohol dehydrogenase-like predicted oxidoreductase